MHSISMAVFGMAGLLAIATILVPIAARANIAVSLLLAITGMVLGWTANMAEFWPLGGPVADFLAFLAGFDLSSEAFILIFLPALLFETAIVIDVRRLMDDLGPILLLAVVAVLVATFSVGLALAAVSDMTLLACLLLAAIVSTTDPIAVVAIFRDLGVPHRLSLLVEGESLFNDAAAISMFSLFLGMLTGGRQADMVDGVLIFMRGFLGGLAVGYVCGRLVCWSISLLRGHRFAEITMTVAASYLTFIIGEHYLHVSGVVAVVTAALGISYYGRTKISATTWTSLVDVWQQIGYWASSLIFLLATMRVPDMLAGMGVSDLVLLAVLVVAALAGRALVLFGLFPILSAVGWAEPVAGPLRAVIVWGGLRGAISLALALAVVESPNIPNDVKTFVSVLCTGFVLFTLFVNAPLLRPLIHLFGLNRLSAADLASRSRALNSALSAVRQRICQAADDYGLDQSLADDLAATYTKRLSSEDGRIESQLHLNAQDEFQSALALLADSEQALYLEHYREGIVNGTVTRRLLATAARVQDGVKMAGADGYLRAHRHSLRFSRSFRLALWLHRRFGIQAFLAREIANRFEILLMLQGSMGQLSALYKAASLHEERSTTDPTRRLRHDPSAATPHTATTHWRAETIRNVRQMLDQRITDIETALVALRLQYADFSRALQSQYLERAAMRIEEQEYRRLRRKAIIGHEVFNHLMADLRLRTTHLFRRPMIDLDLNPSIMVSRVPIFCDLDKKTLDQIVRMLKPVLVVPGECIVRKGEQGNAMYFIASGAVDVAVPPQPIRLGSGDFFGEMALLTGDVRSADICALSFCSLLVLRADDFQALLTASPDVKDHIHQIASQRLATINTVTP